jgi:hypothetical protein
MNYQNGEQIRLGDRVSLWEGVEGKVVCSIDTEEYSTEYPREEWSYLKRGILVESSQAGLIHYPKSEPSLLKVE